MWMYIMTVSHKPYVAGYQYYNWYNFIVYVFICTDV